MMLRSERENTAGFGISVLAVDDDVAVRRALARALELDGFGVTEAVDGERALAALAATPFDVMILDVAMPTMDGIEVCRRVRRMGERMPILMLTARDAVDDRVAGLEAGADDYLVKPFALKELVARLRALLRRSDPDSEPNIRFGDLEMNRVTRIVRRGERQIDLSRTEFSLLELFLTHPRQVLSRQQIFEQVWGYDFGPSSNSLGVYIGYLRRKLEAEGEPRLLQTVRGFGYVLRR